MLFTSMESICSSEVDLQQLLCHLHPGHLAYSSVTGSTAEPAPAVADFTSRIPSSCLMPQEFHLTQRKGLLVSTAQRERQGATVPSSHEREHLSTDMLACVVQPRTEKSNDLHLLACLFTWECEQGHSMSRRI